MFWDEQKTTQEGGRGDSPGFGQKSPVAITDSTTALGQFPEETAWPRGYECMVYLEQKGSEARESFHRSLQA